MHLGGEQADALGKGPRKKQKIIKINDSLDCNLKTLKIKQKKELNAFDALLTDDLLSSSSQFANDVHPENFRNELSTNNKNSAKNKVDSSVRVKPTSVTLVNLLGGKKNRKITYEGLRVLLDTGCSDSLVRATYAKIGEETNKKYLFYRKW